MPTDWKALAKGRGLRVSAEDVDRITRRMDALEQIFAPLALGLSWEDEPATAFRAEAENA